MKYTLFLFYLIISFSSFSQFVDYSKFYGIDINDTPFDLGISKANSFNTFKDQPFFRVSFNPEGYIYEKCTKFIIAPGGGFDFSDEATRKKENCENNLLDKGFFDLFNSKKLVFSTKDASIFKECKLFVLTFSTNFSDQKMSLILNKLSQTYKSPQTSKNMSWGKIYSWKFSNKELIVRKLNKDNTIHVDYTIN